MRRWLAIMAVFAAMAAIVFTLGWSGRLDRGPLTSSVYRARFDRISIGTGQKDVLRQLGPPGHSRIGPGRYTEDDEMIWHLGERDDKVWITIGFENSRVVAKYISPPD